MKAVDLFCGAGGTTTGAQMAGIEVVAAVNHWSRAIETHSANHPTVKHFLQDLSQMDYTTLPEYDLLLASPECRGHCKAKGKENKPVHDKSRATADCVVRAAEITRPKAIVVENVVEMRKWILYDNWRSCLEKLGYTLTEHVVDAALFGVPQNRLRLFVVGTLNGRMPMLTPRRKCKRVPASRVVNLDHGNWSPVKGHAESTVERCRDGWKRFGSDPFLISYYSNTLTARSLDRPIGTVTTRDRWGLVRGKMMRMLSPDEYRRAMGFPETYRLVGSNKDKVKLLGNAVCPPVARAICEAVSDVL